DLVHVLGMRRVALRTIARGRVASAPTRGNALFLLARALGLEPRGLVHRCGTNPAVLAKTLRRQVLLLLERAAVAGPQTFFLVGAHATRGRTARASGQDVRDC